MTVAETTQKPPLREEGASLTKCWKIAVSFQSTSEAREKSLKTMENSNVHTSLGEKEGK